MTERTAAPAASEPLTAAAAAPAPGAAPAPAPATPAPGAAPVRLRPSIAVRRWVLVGSPVLAGLLLVVGVVADPAAGVAGSEMWRIYAEHPDALQWKSFGLHWSYTFWALPAMGAFAFIRGRGAWLANIAGLLGIVGISTLPGMLLSDFYDSAIGQIAGVDATAAVYEAFDGMWAVSAMTLPGNLSHIVCLPVAVAAFWRAGLVRWWALPIVIAGIAALWISTFTWWGAVAMTVAGIALAVEFVLGLRRADRAHRPVDA